MRAVRLVVDLWYNKVMLLVGFFAWWYGAGWRGQILRIGGVLARTNDFFSIGLLLATFFAPFRQISADETGRDIASQFRAWGDRLFSRFIGAFLRFFMIIFGLVATVFVLLISLVRLIVWPIFPFLPVLGAILMLTVGAPWKLV
jgi:hypothetical protein